MDRLARMRLDYRRAGLDEGDLAPTWLEQLRRWLDEAVAAEVLEPNAMTLATATSDGAPSARVVLLKGLDERGLTFFTNLRSRKGAEIEANPRACAVFSWLELQRQVVVTGAVAPLSASESDEYFASRPHGARVAALVSPQSQVIASRGSLDAEFARLSAQYAGDTPIPRPDHWGGLRIVPDMMEFWQGRSERLHDRLRYRCHRDTEWVIERVAP